MDDRRQDDRPDEAARGLAAPLLTMDEAGQAPLLLATIKKRADFQRVRGGVKWSGHGFLMEGKARPASEPGIGARFGLTITKKIGGAVQRNRIRRRLKEALRRLPAALARPDMDYVIVARGPALDMPFASLLVELETALKRIAKPQRTAPRKRN